MLMGEGKSIETASGEAPGDETSEFDPVNKESVEVHHSVFRRFVVCSRCLLMVHNTCNTFPSSMSTSRYEDLSEEERKVYDAEEASREKEEQAGEL
jgi:hypothetical protein